MNNTRFASWIVWPGLVILVLGVLWPLVVRQPFESYAAMYIFLVVSGWALLVTGYIGRVATRILESMHADAIKPRGTVAPPA